MLSPNAGSDIVVRQAGRAPVGAPSAAPRCSSCAMRHLCMPQGLPAEDVPRLEALICGARRVRRGEALYRSGDRFDNLYAVRTGSLKTMIVHRDGREQITGLRLAGEALGLDGIATDVHAFSAVALEDSSICTLPYGALKRLCREVGTMQDRLHRLLGDQFNQEASQMMVLGSLSAEERVAAFLLDVSERNWERGYSHAEFHLRMSREDMGSYLGITLETVSRILSRFQKRNLIDARGKLIRIVDIDGLKDL
ncbi:helix-turn-helix domain-containing protein [Paraburkholderia acidisoli]